LLILAEILKQPIHTSVALERKYFDNFDVQDSLHVGIIVKDFRAIVVHAETLHTSVTARYSHGNRPMQITYESEGIKSEFTLMTRGNTAPATSSASTNTPARDLSVRPVSRISNGQRSASVPATTQDPSDTHPSKTLAPTANPLPPEILDPLNKILRPAPSASINPDSLFIPADDDQQWDAPNFDEQPDMVTWNASEYPSFSESGRRIRDSEPTSFRGVQEQQFGGVQEIAPTQRLSQVRGLLD
jgi:cell cycle checkpoint control protein RAD9A